MMIEYDNNDNNAALRAANAELKRLVAARDATITTRDGVITTLLAAQPAVVVHKNEKVAPWCCEFCCCGLLVSNGML